MFTLSGEEKGRGVRRREEKEREERGCNKAGDLSRESLPHDDRVGCCNTQKQGDRVSLSKEAGT